MKTIDAGAPQKSIFDIASVTNSNISPPPKKSIPVLNKDSNFDHDKNLICPFCGFFISKDALRIDERAYCLLCDQKMISANIFSIAKNDWRCYG